jgi:acyl carrier protein
MGLDGVELVMEVEDRFNVKLSDSECERFHTVADLAALVVSKLPKSTDTCPTARAFFSLRSLLVTHAAVERRRVRPRTRLEDLLASQRRQIWAKLRRHERRLPRLVATQAQERAFLWVGAIFAFSWFMASAVLWGTRGAGPAIPIAVAALFIGVFAFVAVTGAFRRQFPMGLETVGDLATFLTPVEMPGGGVGERLIVQQRVLEEVRRITAQQLGLPLDKVQASSDFVKDLDVG